MLAIVAFLLAFIALILKLVHAHNGWIVWLLIFAVLVLSAGVVAYIRGWHDPLYRARA